MAARVGKYLLFETLGEGAFGKYVFALLAAVQVNARWPHVDDASWRMPSLAVRVRGPRRTRFSRGRLACGCGFLVEMAREMGGLRMRPGCAPPTALGGWWTPTGGNRRYRGVLACPSGGVGAVFSLADG